MVYKYWNSITVRLSLDCPLDPSTNVYHFFTQREDLEFSVGSKAAVWEVKDPLLTASATAPGGDYEEDSSSFHAGAASLVGGVSGTQYYGGKPGYSAPGPGWLWRCTKGLRPTAIEELRKDI